MNVEPAEGIQSWAQMLASVTSSDQVLSAVVVSSSSEIDDTTGRDVLQDNRSQDKPPVISKVGKKAKVRKHAKKKKKAQATQDEKKGGTSRSKQKDAAVEQLEGSKLSIEVKSEDDSNTPLPVNKPDDKVEHHDQGEDVNKIKMRLEAQISARKGFGVVPSQEVIYDKVCTCVVLTMCLCVCVCVYVCVSVHVYFILEPANLLLDILLMWWEICMWNFINLVVDKINCVSPNFFPPICNTCI